MYSRFESVTITLVDRDVKTRRPHEGAARQARTRRTWTAVVEAARTLFVERGYAATTIEAISDLSDTPQATVYRLFSSKLGILKAVLDISVVGDNEAVAMADRPRVRALLSDRDPTKTPLCCSPRSLGNARRASTASPAHSLVRESCGPDSESVTPPTSSTRSRLRRFTAYSSSTEAGAVSGTRSG